MRYFFLIDYLYLNKPAYLVGFLCWHSYCLVIFMGKEIIEGYQAPLLSQNITDKYKK